MRPFKVCPCCRREHTRLDWLMLPWVGLFEGLELRNCHCRSTIAVAATPVRIIDVTPISVVEVMS